MSPHAGGRTRAAADGGARGASSANTQPKAEAYYQKPTDTPTIESKLRQQHDPTDPAEAWQHFGATKRSVYEALRMEPSGVLLAMLRHWNMPGGPAPMGKHAEYLARNIAERLEAQYHGRPMASRRTSEGTRTAASVREAKGSTVAKTSEQQHAEQVARAHKRAKAKP